MLVLKKFIITSKNSLTTTSTIKKSLHNLVSKTTKQNLRHPHHHTSSSNNMDATVKSLMSNTSLKSISSTSQLVKIKVIPIKALQDNYMYLLIDDSTKQAAAVDPVNASAMASAVHDYEVDLKAILTTHHHHDHAHGNADMLDMFPDLIVYGGDNRIQSISRIVGHQEKLKLGSLSIECLSTPCHTKGHICYYVTCDREAEPTTAAKAFADSDTTTTTKKHLLEPGQERVVFTGDTLFVAGCGRFFEGSSEQMNSSLNHTLANLPNDTLVYCGHEYTVQNLKFALSVEPQNIDIKNKLAWAQDKQSKREPTIPSTIGEEKKINPFMRLKQAQVKKFTNETEELEVMTILRHKKNEFS